MPPRNDEQRIIRAQRQRRRVVHDGVDERFTHLGLIHHAEIEQRGSWQRPVPWGLARLRLWTRRDR